MVDQSYNAVLKVGICEMNDFKSIKLEDKPIFDDFFAQDPPQCSEYTFTNLFMWKERYRTTWRVWKDCLLIVFCPGDDVHYGLQPIGQGDKRAALDYLADHVSTLTDNVQVCRVAENFIEEHVSSGRYEVIKDRDNSDYVYLAQELAELPGNKFHKKKNHVNKFIKNKRPHTVPKIDPHRCVPHNKQTVKNPAHPFTQTNWHHKLKQKFV